MMETEAPRPAPPSRYRTVRRRPQAPAAPPPASPPQTQQQQQPQEQQQQQQQQRLYALPNSPSSGSNPQRQERHQQQQQRYQQNFPPSHPQPLRSPPLNNAVSSSPPTSPPLTAHAEHASRFRRMLKLNTHHSDHAQHQTPAAVPASAPPRTPHKLHKLPVRSKTEDEVMDAAKKAARDEAVAALEGKSSKSRPRAMEEPKPKKPPAKVDQNIKLWFEKRGPVDVGIPKDITAEGLLEQVRPGHDRYLTECWPSLGLVRPVRYFEPVTDVINTWDQFGSSYLCVTKKVWGESGMRLDQFPRSAPSSGEALFYYYATADKKWSKRTISLENGAIRIVKKDRPSDKDHIQSIPMDYFDVYSFQDTFSPDRKLKFPTKYGFAVKSQHRQSLFGKDSVFVHYFAVETEETLNHWFGMIRDLRARSIAEKKRCAPWAELESEPERSPPGKRSSGGHTKPLVPSDSLPKPPPIPNSPQAVQVARSKSLHRNKSTKQPGTNSRSRATSSSGGQQALAETGPMEVFSPGGLLGNDYEEKKRLAMKTYKEERVKDGLFQSKAAACWNQAPNLQHRGDTSPRQGSRKSASIHSAGSGEDHSAAHLKRSHTTAAATPRSRPTTARDAPTDGPLLSFAKHEINVKVPHRNRGGRGYSVSDKEREAGGLISHVTSNDDVPPMPTSAPTRYKSLKANKSRRKDDGYQPFTGTGLLASHAEGFGAQKTGHGVKTFRDVAGRNGDRPLMDVGSGSVFAPGSLLEQRERETGPTRPVIDRDDRSSGDEK